MQSTPKPTVLSISSDHHGWPTLEAYLRTCQEVQALDTAPDPNAAIVAAKNRHPGAILVAADLPGAPVILLTQDLRDASPVSKIIILGPGDALDGDMLMRLQERRISGYFAWEGLRLDVVRHCIVMEDDILMTSAPVLSVSRATPERRAAGSARSSLPPLTPSEPANGSPTSHCVSDVRAGEAPQLSATLWADDPDLAAVLHTVCARCGIVFDVVYSRDELLHAATPLRSGHIFVIDCTTAKDASARCQAAIARIVAPILICHAAKEFVDDLRQRALGPLHWLPPSYTGLALRDKLAALAVAPPAPTLTLPGPPSSMATSSQPLRAATPALFLAASEEALFADLSEREREVLALTEMGVPYEEIGARLFITKNTVKSHAAHIRTKLGLPAHQDLGRAYRQWHEGMTTG